MTEQDPESISARLCEPFPVEHIDFKNGLAYVPQELVRDRLISATNNRFDWTIDQVLFRDDGVTRRTDRATGEAKRPISMIVIGTLTIPGLGSRAGIGAHPLDEGAGEDAAYKSAESDAFKRAAMSFGVGLRQLYIDKASTSNRSSGNRRSAPPPARQQANTNPPPSPISDKVFADQVKAAIAQKDGEAFRRLADVAGTSDARWSLLVKACETIPALDWVVRQMERRDLPPTDTMVRTVETTRTRLAV